MPAGVDPGGADHDGLRQRGQDRLFAGQLGLPVDAQRPGLVVHLIGMRRGVAEVAAEHIVGRDVDQPRAYPRAGLRDVSGPGRVDRVCRGLVSLGAVDVGVGRAVDHHVAGLHDLPGGRGSVMSHCDDVSASTSRPCRVASAARKLPTCPPAPVITIRCGTVTSLARRRGATSDTAVTKVVWCDA